MKDWKNNNVNHETYLYKCIKNKSIANDHHTTKPLEERLERLPGYVISCDSELTKFHLDFNNTKGLHTSCRKNDLNFTKYLWQSYKIYDDSEFGE